MNTDMGRAKRPGRDAASRQSPEPENKMPEYDRTQSAIKTSEDEEAQKRITPFQLLNWLMETYGEAWADWEPETLYQTLAQDLGSPPDEAMFNVIMALQILLLRTEAFWADPPIFEDTILGLNGITPNFGGPDDMSPGQLVYGVWVAQELAPMTPTEQVQTYAAARLFEAGLIVAMYPVTWAQPMLDRICQNQGGGDCQVNKDIVWERFKSLANTPLEETGLSDTDPIDRQVARMLVVRDYIELHEGGLA